MRAKGSPGVVKRRPKAPQGGPKGIPRAHFGGSKGAKGPFLSQMVPKGCPIGSHRQPFVQKWCLIGAKWYRYVPVVLYCSSVQAATLLLKTSVDILQNQCNEKKLDVVKIAWGTAPLPPWRRRQRLQRRENFLTPHTHPITLRDSPGNLPPGLVTFQPAIR